MEILRAIRAGLDAGPGVGKVEAPEEQEHMIQTARTAALVAEAAEALPAQAAMAVAA
jgi:hypothetical protein